MKRFLFSVLIALPLMGGCVLMHSTSDVDAKTNADLTLNLLAARDSLYAYQNAFPGVQLKYDTTVHHSVVLPGK